MPPGAPSDDPEATESQPPSWQAGAVSDCLLLIEDDEALGSALESWLTAAGYDVLRETDGTSGLRTWRARSPAVVLLDLGLPGANGHAVLAARGGLPPAVVLVLSASADLSTRVSVLEAGADDYLPKPLYPEELLARIRRRLQPPEPRAGGHDVVVFEGVAVDLDAHRCTVDGREARLTPTEWGVLETLVRRAGRAVSRATLLDVVFDDPGERLERSVDAHVSRLRRKLGPAHERLRAVWGIGWRLDL